MLENTVKSVTGFECEAIDESGDCVAVYAPRPFRDDPEVFLYIEKRGHQLSLTDAAEVSLYHGNCDAAIDAIAAIVQRAGLEFTDGAIKYACEPEDLGPAVLKFLSTMSTLAHRERAFNYLWARSLRDSDAMAVK